MTQPIERDPIYRGRRFQTETMMADRGIIVSYTTIMRWVSRYVPEFERCWNRYARPMNSPGAWMSLRLPLGADFTICIGRSTSGENPSGRCCVQIAGWMPQRNSSGKH